MDLKYTKPTKSNSQTKILRMLSREEELSRSQGAWVAMNRAYKNKKKYDRKSQKKELRKDLSSFCFHNTIAYASITLRTA